MELFKGVVFDCDGVLVDTEPLSMQVTQKAIAALGWHPPIAEMYQLFLGCSKEYLQEVVEDKTGLKLERDWLASYRAFRNDLFRRELKEIPGISFALERIDLPIALASNSSHAHIKLALEIVGLYPTFQQHISSAEDVPRGKPAPDVYLHAARQLGLEPAECIAIDDSRAGVRSAMAAGMHVLAYETSLAPQGSFADLDVKTFNDMRDLPGLVSDLNHVRTKSHSHARSSVNT
ncbi:HAD family hydrolase [Paramicrobacterium agarici]|uniref:HAD family hydrolase n=1 Tax=Paramicrobacterium agarici TaxID=630514 RepID=UPI00114E0FBE|nr:HAD family phosphatase [Microbacterium agarici]TQO22968.1 HAD superfamily hydrolase (TIGR01509 family) [Microbacterium agarici]